MSVSSNSPVFVVGSSRSGTTLMYSILLSSGDFAIYEAETMLLTVCRPKYGNIRRNGNYERFIRDWIQSKQFYRSKLDSSEFRQKAKAHHASYTEFMGFFMEETARNQGKNRWAEQTPGYVFHMKEISEAFPDAKFIHVIRDGRDVALSRRKLGWTSSRSEDPVKQLVCAAVDWQTCVEAGQRYGTQLRNRYMEIKYEDLIKNTDVTLNTLSSFLGINVPLEDLESSTVGSLRKGNTAFNGEMNGISRKGLHRWKSDLTPEEIQILDISIGQTLKRLGYELGEVPLSYNWFKRSRIIANARLWGGFLKIKNQLRDRTFLGRYGSENIEIGQH